MEGHCKRCRFNTVCNGCTERVDIINAKPLAGGQIERFRSTGKKLRIKRKPKEHVTGKKLYICRKPTKHVTSKKSVILIQDETDTVQDYDDIMAGQLLSDTVQEDGCDDLPCPSPFCADAFHKGKIKTPGSLAGSSTNPGFSSHTGFYLLCQGGHELPLGWWLNSCGFSRMMESLKSLSKKQYVDLMNWCILV